MAEDMLNQYSLLVHDWLRSRFARPAAYWSYCRENPIPMMHLDLLIENGYLHFPAARVADDFYDKWVKPAKAPKPKRVWPKIGVA